MPVRKDDESTQEYCQTMSRDTRKGSIMFRRQSVREFEAELRGRGRRSADPPPGQSFRDFEAQLRLGRQAAATRDGRIARHRGDLELTWDQACAALAALEGSWVSVRVVESTFPEMLVGVAEGILGRLTRSKHPAYFWPVDRRDGDPAGGEEPGFYLRHDHFEGAVGRAGNSVLLISQGPVVINVRRVGSASTTAARPR